jgi:Acyl-CoA thioesterase C-terminal domain/Acyl-CoA thioesterase N-terminal domain
VDTAFFEPAGSDTFAATAATVGPWSPAAQHGGPPSALAARVMAAFEPAPGQRLASVAVDILRPVPVGKLTARTRTVRPGRRVALVETVLEADGQEVLHARGWKIQLAAVPATSAPAPPPVPPAGGPSGMTWEGYGTAMEWRYVSGAGLAEPGPSAVWMRPLIPLLPGEDISPMSRALLCGDSGSGVSSVLDVRDYLFINVNMNVMLHRDPGGEWLLLDAVTAIGPDGTGVAASTLSDPAGPVGQVAQTLLVAPQ